jgi:hypothetical protein
VLDFESPIQGLLRLYSRYGPPDRSGAHRRPLSRGSNPCGYPHKPLVSYRINRQLSGWILPPLMIRAFGAHCHDRTHALQHDRQRERPPHGGLSKIRLAVFVRRLREQRKPFASCATSREGRRTPSADPAVSSMTGAGSRQSKHKRRSLCLDGIFWPACASGGGGHRARRFVGCCGDQLGMISAQRRVFITT